MSQLSKEEKRFIFRTLRAAAGGQGAAWEEFDFKSVNWMRIISHCRVQRVLPFIAYYWESQKCLPQFPAEVQKEMTLSMLLAQGRSAEKIRDFKEIASILNQAGISVMPLKGVSFLFSIYKEQPFRVMADVDILIRREDLSKARRALSTAGFSDPCRSCYRWRDDIFHTDGVPEDWSLYGGHCFENKKIQADVHWEPHFFVEETRLDLKAAQFWERAEPLAGFSPNAYQMSPLDAFDFAFFHALDFHSTSLVNFLDLAVMMRRYGITPDHLRLKGVPSVPSKKRPSLEHFLTMLQELFFSEKEEGDFSKSTGKILEDTLEMQINPPPKEIEEKRSSLSYFSDLKCFKNKLFFLAGYFFPNPEYYFPDRGWKMHSRHWKKIVSKLFGAS